MRKKREENLKYLILESINDYVMDLYEGYIKIELGEILYKNNIELDFVKCLSEFTVYVKDKDLCDEVGFYDDICELYHCHYDDLLYCFYHLNEEISNLKKRLTNYLKYKNKGE